MTPDPRFLVDEVVIPARFRGPPTSANGGYACGVCAAGHGGPVEVTLRRPIPLEVPLLRDERGLRRGDEVLAELLPATLTLEVPRAPSFADAEAASAHYAGFASHPFPGCFVCGPQRAAGDGLRLFPGPVDGLVAAPLVPHPGVCAEGRMLPECVWAALDCPTYFGAFVGREHRTAMLGRLTAEIRDLPREGARCVVVGWPISEEGRKSHGGAAIVGEDGRWLARSRGTWIAVR